jgi:hypothetical protein
MNLENTSFDPKLLHFKLNEIQTDLTGYKKEDRNQITRSGDPVRKHLWKLHVKHYDAMRIILNNKRRDNTLAPA